MNYQILGLKSYFCYNKKTLTLIKGENKMITLTVEKDWAGKYTFIVSNGFDSQSLTPGTFVSDFQIDQAKQNIQYAGSIDDGIRVVKNALGIF